LRQRDKTAERAMMRVLAVDIGATKFAAAVIDGTGTIHRRAELPIGGIPMRAELPIGGTPTHIELPIGGTPTRADLPIGISTGAELPNGGTPTRADLPIGGTPTHIELPNGGTPTAVLQRVIEAVITDDVAAVGIGTAGPLDRIRGTVSPVNIPAWRDFPLTATVRRLVPGVPVHMAGDAQCLALGEWWHWPGTRPPEMAALLGIVVSTGIGGGLVLDGQPYLGPTGNAGHIGHITVDPYGEACPCGAIGCVETIASGPAIARWAVRNGWKPANGADARALVAAAQNGLPVARAAFERAAGALTTALLTTAALCDIDHVVIGGGVAAAGDTLLRPIRQALSRRGGMAFLQRMRVRESALGRDGGLYGAAALAQAQPVAAT
jgi:glucokinase